MSKEMRIGVLGAGNWGTALAQHMAMSGHDVRLWAYEPEVVSGINTAHKNPFFLSERALSERLVATGQLDEAVREAELVLFVIPAQLMRGYLIKIRDALPPSIPLVICAKGIERKTLATMDQVFLEELPGKHHAGISVLSGPSFAAEVARGVPTNLTVAAREPETAKRVQAAVATRALRVYTSDDVVGVEIGGALKNVIAIAVGACEGMGFGLNTQAAIITRGLADLTRLAMVLGGRSETMLGLAGVGDLVLTCTGELSRNRQVGKLLAQGRTREEIERDMRMVAEGIPTAESAHELAHKHAVDLPICEQVYDVLYRGKTVQDALRSLQDRALKDEWAPSEA